MSSVKIPLGARELETVSGGTDWARDAGGSFLITGDHIVYTAAEGDTLSGIAVRYSVTVGQLRSWNSLKDADTLTASERIIIYPGIIR